MRTLREVSTQNKCTRVPNIKHLKTELKHFHLSLNSSKKKPKQVKKSRSKLEYVLFIRQKS